MFWSTSSIKKKEHQELSVLFKPVVAAQKIKMQTQNQWFIHSSCKTTVLKERSKLCWSSTLVKAEKVEANLQMIHNI